MSAAARCGKGRWCCCSRRTGPETFLDADKVLIDRQAQSHAAFGLGIHRCIGSNLARMEMVVALQDEADSAFPRSASIVRSLRLGRKERFAAPAICRSGLDDAVAPIRFRMQQSKT